ncbi:MAG TPA: tetratricopeptide repeat protein [bacterium]|nr:tetratricopeptide repeat protein [bacterium]
MKKAICAVLVLLFAARAALAADPEPTPPREPAAVVAPAHAPETTPGGAAWRSAILPGWGQRYKGETRKGKWFTITWSVLAVASLSTLAAKVDANRTYTHLSDTASNTAYDTAFQRDLQTSMAFDIVGGATAAFWAYNVADSGFRGADPLRIRDARIHDVFPAMAQYYQTNPLASITVENRSGDPLTNLRVHLEAPEVMSAPAEAPVVETLAPGLAREISLRAAFTDRIFDVGRSEPRSVAARVVVEYEAKGRKKSLERTATFTVYNRNAIVWDDIRKLGSFVTPREKSVLDFAAVASKKKPVGGPSKNIATAALYFDAMSAAGITYLADPETPFSQFEGNAAAVDTVSFPHETLARKTGDCDDLTALYASLLESSGVPAALVDVPGHVYVLFDSGLKPEEFRRLAGNDQFVTRNGTAWLPVETTALGKSFAAAWDIGFEETRKWTSVSRFTAADVLAAQSAFPTTLPAFSDTPAAPLDEKVLASLVDSDRARLTGAEKQTRDRAIAEIRARHLPPDIEANEIGIALANTGRLAEAKTSFQQALAVNPRNGKALNNLGNLLYAAGDKAGALHDYLQALDVLGESPAVLVNLAQIYLDLGQAAQATTYFERARKADALYVSDYAELGALLHPDSATAKKGAPPANAARAGNPDPPPPRGPGSYVP